MNLIETNSIKRNLSHPETNYNICSRYTQIFNWKENLQRHEQLGNLEKNQIFIMYLSYLVKKRFEPDFTYLN